MFALFEFSFRIVLPISRNRVKFKFLPFSLTHTHTHTMPSATYKINQAFKNGFNHNQVRFKSRVHTYFELRRFWVFVYSPTSNYHFLTVFYRAGICLCFRSPKIANTPNVFNFYLLINVNLLLLLLFRQKVQNEFPRIWSIFIESDCFRTFFRFDEV